MSIKLFEKKCMMKFISPIIGLILLSVLIGCSSMPKWSFYDSKASISSFSSSIRSDFKNVELKDESLPFSLFSAIDSNLISKQTDYYVLFTVNEVLSYYSKDFNAEINNTSISISPEKIQELIKYVNKALALFDTKSKNTDVSVVTYDITKEYNKVRISENVEHFSPELIFSTRAFDDEVICFINLTFGKSTNNERNMLYNFDKESLSEFLYRLVKSLEVLKEMGMKN